ncbi:MAG: hypothetical protein ABIF92_00405 [archaeon]
MNIGKFIRQSLSDYLNNPIMLLPFAIMGLITTGLGIFSKYYLYSNLGLVYGATMDSLLTLGEIPFSLFPVLLKYSFLVFISIIFLSFINSFFHAFAIGLAKKIAAGKTAEVSDGLSFIDAGFSVFSFKVLIWLFTSIGAVIIILPSLFLFGFFGLVFGGILVVFYVLLLQFVGFFGKQAVVLENLNAWAALQRSYLVIKRNLENVLLLLGAYLFFFAAFFVFQKIFVSLAVFIISGFSLVVFTQAADFIFTFLILSPLFVIIKTSYFVKKAPKQRVRAA